jgi:hypothetical protein
MRGILVVLAVIASFFVASVSGAADADRQAIETWLAKPVVGQSLPLAEVQRFCEGRVVRMPQVSTVAQWEAEAKRLREETLAKVVYRGEAARWRDAPVKVEWLDTIPGGPGYSIRKLRYEAVPGLWIPAVVYLPEKLVGKTPVVMNVNGHVGAPGKSVPYKQIRCINQAKRGMIAMNVEWLGMGQLGGEGFYHYRANQLDLCGTAAVAPFFLSMKRGLDILLSMENADPKRVAVAGLSGGGWQTAFIGGLDPRVTLANPVAGYSSFRTRAYVPADLGDTEQSPTDLGAVADYCHLTAMRAPHATLLTNNAHDDCCFAAADAIPFLMEAARPIYRLYDRESALRFHVNEDPGNHNFELDNREAFYRMLGDFFYPGDRNYSAKEISSDKELKTQAQLDVPLPASQADFHTLAAALAKDLPRDAALPVQTGAVAAWQAAKSARLRQIVRAADYRVHAIDDGRETKNGVSAVFRRLQMSGAWTVPSVELAGPQAKEVVLLLSDAGRAKAADTAASLVRQGRRVVAIDPFYFGESHIAARDSLYALLVSAVGERPLGIQASQVAAAARWARDRFGAGPVRVVAVGPRSSTFALVAAALERDAIAGVEVHDPLGSLKEVIEKNRTVEQMPEWFCFGLLAEFDIRQIAALVAPRPVDVRAPGVRARAELAGLRDWYKLLGRPLDPVQ